MPARRWSHVGTVVGPGDGGREESSPPLVYVPLASAFDDDVVFMADLEVDRVDLPAERREFLGVRVRETDDNRRRWRRWNGIK